MTPPALARDGARVVVVRARPPAAAPGRVSSPAAGPALADVLRAAGVHTLGEDPPPEAMAAVLARLRELAGAGGEEAGDEPARPIVRSLAEILADPAALEPPVPVVSRLAWRGRTTLLAAREKDGKSTLATAAAAHVSRGAHWLGDATAAGSVLVVALEEHVADVAGRLAEWGADPATVHVVESLATADDPLGAIRDAVEEVRPLLLVVDTLAALVDHLSRRPDPGDSVAWTPIMAALTRIARDMDTALLLLHHARKSDGRYRDSTAIGAGVDVIVEMEPDSSDPDVRRMRVRARWRVGDYAVRLLPVADGPGHYDLAAGEVSVDARVLHHVQADPGCSLRRLREHVGGRSALVDAALARLLERGALVEREGARGARELYPAETPGTRSGTRSPEPTVSPKNGVDTPRTRSRETVAGAHRVPDRNPSGGGADTALPLAPPPPPDDDADEAPGVRL